MAVPTFTSVIPANGPGGGRFVAEIIGTDFRLSAALVPAVRVEFDGVIARDVRVLSATEVQVVVPSLRREDGNAAEDPLPPIDIKILNLDDAGVPIGGEEVTAVTAFTYERSPIRDPRATAQNQIYRQIILEVIHNFKRQLLPNTAIFTGVDYGSDGSIKVTTSTLPAIALDGPRLSEDFDNRHHWNGPLEIVGVGESTFKFSGRLMTMEFDVVIASNRLREIYGLSQGLVEMFMRTPVLTLPETVGDWSAAQLHEFPMVLTIGPNISTQDGDANLHIADATFQIRHIPFRLEELIDRLDEVDTAQMDIFPFGDPSDPWEFPLF